VQLGDYLGVIQRQWRLIVVCVLLAVGLGALLTLRATPQYAATSRLFVSTPGSDTSAAYQGGLFSQQRVSSYADLVTGDEIAQRVIDRLGLHEQASQLSGQISANVVPETVILDVTVTDPNPRLAQRLDRAVAQEFTDYITELETPPGRHRAPIKATVVDPAPLPRVAVSPQPLRNVGLAALLGLLLGVGAAVLRETLNTSVRTPEDIAAASEAPILGSIAYDADAAKQPLVTSLDTHAPRVEAFRVLRTNLQFVDVDRASKLFLVTSSLPGEGKTTTATNLAVTLARAGQRVVLLEGDLRRPKVAEYLGLESVVGLTTVLVGRLAMNEALQPWGRDGLVVLTSGATPPNPSELLQSHSMARVLADLRRRFDVIVVDAPPLLPVTDAALLAAQADGTLLVVRHGRTKREQVRGSVERVHAVGGHLVGVVLNMAPHRGSDAYSYGYGYGYGYAPAAGRRRADVPVTDPAAAEPRIQPIREPYVDEVIDVR
jgi:capsular exopolysaccharide synthesis family protein